MPTGSPQSRKVEEPRRNQDLLRGAHRGGRGRYRRLRTRRLRHESPLRILELRSRRHDLGRTAGTRRKTVSRHRRRTVTELRTTCRTHSSLVEPIPYSLLPCSLEKAYLSCSFADFAAISHHLIRAKCATCPRSPRVERRRFRRFSHDEKRLRARPRRVSR